MVDSPIFAYPAELAAAAGLDAAAFEPTPATVAAPLPVLLGSKTPAVWAQKQQPKRRRPAPLRFDCAEDAAPLVDRGFRVHNTFIDSAVQRSPSLEDFYRERQVSTCPSKHVGRLAALAGDDDAPASAPAFRLGAAPRTPRGGAAFEREGSMPGSPCGCYIETPCSGAFFQEDAFMYWMDRPFGHPQFYPHFPADGMCPCLPLQDPWGHVGAECMNYPYPYCMEQLPLPPPSCMPYCGLPPLHLGPLFDDECGGAVSGMTSDSTGAECCEAAGACAPVRPVVSLEHALAAYDSKASSANAPDAAEAQQAPYVYPEWAGCDGKPGSTSECPTQDSETPIGVGAEPLGLKTLAPLAPPSPPSSPAPGSKELPSIGSAAHISGDCKPCAFLHTKGCENGLSCNFCHLCEPGEKKRRQREKLEKMWICASSQKEATAPPPVEAPKGGGGGTTGRRAVGRRGARRAEAAEPRAAVPVGRRR